MATSKDFCDQVLAQLNSVGGITCRPMMGEYLIYCRGVLIGGIYDNKLLLKETPSGARYHLQCVSPYPSAKRTMYYVENLSDPTYLRGLILNVYTDLAPNNSDRTHKD